MRDILHHQFSTTLEGAVRIPERAGNIFSGKTSGARAHKALGELPCPIKPNHKKGQTALAHALKRSEAMGKLLETHRKTTLEYGKIVTFRFAVSQEAALGHEQGGCEIAFEMAFEECPGGLVLELSPLCHGHDLVAFFELRDLKGELEIARGRSKHFRKLDLAGMQIEPAEAVGQNLLRQYSHRKLVALAQTFRQRKSDTE